MPSIDLNHPTLNDRDPANQPVLADLQCNTLAPHRRNRSVHLFLKLPDDPAAALAYVRGWAGRVTPLAAQLSVEVTRRALKKNFLENCSPVLARRPVQFAGSMRGVVRSFMLTCRGVKKLPAWQQDPTVPLPRGPWRDGGRDFEPQLYLEQPTRDDALRGWHAPFDTDDGPDAHILLAADGPNQTGQACPAMSPQLSDALQQERTNLGAAQGRQLGPILDGYACLHPAGEFMQEHFGFADGISHLAFLQSDAVWRAANLPNPDFGTRLKNILTEWPGRPGVYGSFFVFRQIQQHVDRFTQLTTAAAEEVMGRRRVDSAALVPGAPTGRNVNNFNFNGDTAGRCPFHAHIRKSNPRGSSDRPAVEPQTLFARRGMLYGARAYDQATHAFVGLPKREVGLLFMAYMGSISDQFERMQQGWMANPDFPRAGAGIDPLVGLQSSRGLSRYTTVRGSELFFVPPISWLQDPR